MFEWIDRNERLPPNDVYVLVCNRHLKSEMNFVQIGKRFNEKWVDDKNEDELNDKKYIITHWMPIPDDPSKCVEKLSPVTKTIVETARGMRKIGLIDEEEFQKLIDDPVFERIAHQLFHLVVEIKVLNERIEKLTEKQRYDDNL